jgi:hypothetical protein
MPTGARRPRPRFNAGAAALAAALLLITLGGVAFFLLGREDPADPASSALGWGDRVERRMDAYIDGVRPEWTDRVEERLDAAIDRAGREGEQNKEKAEKAEKAGKAPAGGRGAGE